MTKSSNEKIFSYLTIEHIIGFLTVHLNQELYKMYKSNIDLVYPKAFRNSIYKDNVLKDLVDKIAILINSIRNCIKVITTELMIPIFIIENKSVCLIFEAFIDGVVKINNLQRTIWSYTKYKIFENVDAGYSTRIKLIKI